jgi:hypothetical protein
MSARYLGDFTPGKTIRGRFNTVRPSTGAPFTLAGTPTLAVYKDGGTTESTAGVTLTVDFDARTGMHFYAIDTSADGTFYSAASDFTVVLTAGTVDSVSAVGLVVGAFSLANRSALRPTTADRTLDVSAGGEAGLDWANVGSPTTTLNLSGTTISTSQAIQTVTTATNLTNLPSIPANWLTAAGIAASALNGKGDWNVGKTGYSLTATTGLGNQTANITGNLSGSVGSVTGAVGSVTGAVGSVTAAVTVGTINANVITASALATDAVAEISDGVWDEVLSGHMTAGSTGNALNAAGSAGDPWSTALPGAYGAGTAGKIIGDNLNATVSSRLASASYTAPLDASGVRTALGVSSPNLDTQLSAIDTVVDSILADTGTDGVVVAAASKSGYALSSSGLDSITIETGLNMRQATSLIAASAAGKLSGAATTTITIDGAGVNTDRIVATVDADGNRTAITLSPPA